MAIAVQLCVVMVVKRRVYLPSARSLTGPARFSHTADTQGVALHTSSLHSGVVRKMSLARDYTIRLCVPDDRQVCSPLEEHKS